MRRVEPDSLPDPLAAAVEDFRGFFAGDSVFWPPDSARDLAALALAPRPESASLACSPPDFLLLDFLVGSISVFSQ